MWRRVEFMKSTPFATFFNFLPLSLALRSKYTSQHPILEHLHLLLELCTLFPPTNFPVFPLQSSSHFVHSRVKPANAGYSTQDKCCNHAGNCKAMCTCDVSCFMDLWTTPLIRGATIIFMKFYN
jgi:hypothetical protein